MNSRFKMIGYKSRVDYEWLRLAVSLQMQGLIPSEIRKALSERLRDVASRGNDAHGSSREKIITILMRTWVTVAPELTTLRDGALKLLQRLSAEEQTAIHWGMMMAAYPFWGYVAEATGRLLNLQSTISAKQIQRRTAEKYGQRETVHRATRYVVYAFQNWGVLKRMEKPGLYKQGQVQIIQDIEVLAWLFEAMLHAKATSKTSLRMLYSAPSLFPFNIERISKDAIISHSDRITIIRHNIDDELVTLA